MQAGGSNDVHRGNQEEQHHRSSFGVEVTPSRGDEEDAKDTIVLTTAINTQANAVMTGRDNSHVGRKQHMTTTFTNEITPLNDNNNIRGAVVGAAGRCQATNTIK